MEVRGGQLPDRRPVQERLREALHRATEANRTRTREVQDAVAQRYDGKVAARREALRRERTQGTGPDRIEVSDLARQAGAQEASRAEHVQELREAHQSGELLTPERTEKAARNILDP